MTAVSFLRKHVIVACIASVLFLLPFSWYPKGAIDIGGDGNRLYFYDPVSFLKNVSLYSVTAEGKANADPLKHAYLTYVAFLAMVKYFIGSPHTLINGFNGIKLSAAFVSIYLIVKEVILHGFVHKRRTLTVELAAVLAGLFYVVSTGSEQLIFFWVKALHSHDQIFLNPLIFFLTLRYVLTRKRWYLIAVLLLTFLFSVDFAMISSPSFFAFYPLAFVFLFLYVQYVRKARISIRNIALVICFFLGIQAYHLLPSLVSFFDSSSVVNSLVFRETVSGGVNFFWAIHGQGKAIKSLLLPSPVESLRWTTALVPAVTILGFLVYKKKQPAMFLTALFFFITFFLVTANITDVGLAFYRILFYIPGFSMFRHFFVQWAYVYLFFYALLFGQSLFVLASRLKTTYTMVLVSIMVLLWSIGFYPFLNGTLVDGIQWGSNNVKTALIMDPRYEEVLAYVRGLPDDGKILMLPLTDNFNQVVFGLNNAAYVGPSMFSLLTPKKSFTGYQILYPNPIPEVIMKFAHEKNYAGLHQIFSLFSIRYIFHNTDPKVYEEKFPNFPNSYMMTSLPKTQEEYKAFVRNFPVTRIYANGPYELYEFDRDQYRPEIYIPDSLSIGDPVNFVGTAEVSHRSAFIDQQTCTATPEVSALCAGLAAGGDRNISFQKRSPVVYDLRITNGGSNPFLVVFQNSFHRGWKLMRRDGKAISEGRHLLVNAYANGWIVTPDDVGDNQELGFSLRFEPQKYFRYGLVVSAISLIALLVFAI